MGSSRISNSGYKGGEANGEALLLPARQAQHGRLFLLAQVDCLEDLRHSKSLWIEGSEKPERLFNGQGFRELGVLKLNAELLPQLHRVPLRIEPQHAHGARCSGPETLEDLDERGLSSAVGSEKTNNAACSDLD